MSQTIESLQIGVEIDTKKLDILSNKIKRAANDITSLNSNLKGAAKGSAEYDKLNTKLEKLTDSYQLLNLQAKQYANKIDEGTSRMVALREETKRSNSAFGAFWDDTRKGALGFNGTLLSLLFFGMELQRVFTGALRNIFEGYKKIIPESHKFNIETTRLSANWQFFKFQLVDALSNSPLFTRFIGFLINIIRRLQGMSEEAKTITMVLIGVGAALGAILFIVGVWGMGMAAIHDMAVGIGLALNEISFGGITSSMGKFAAILGVVALIAAGLLIAVGSLNKFKESSDYASAASDSLGQGWLKLLDQVFRPLSDLLGNMNFSFQSLGEVGVFIGSVLTTAFAGVGMLLSSLVGIVQILFNALTALGKYIASNFVSAINAVLKGIKEIKEYFGFNTSGLTRTINELDRMSESIRDSAWKDLTADIAEAGYAAQQTIDTLNQAVTNPFTAVDEYRKKLEYDAIVAEHDKILTDLNTQESSGGESTTNNYFVIDQNGFAEDTQRAEDLLRNVQSNLGVDILPR